MTKISASRIDKYTMCPRRYAFNYLKERREAAGTAASAGTALHLYLETGELKDVPPGYNVPSLAEQMKPFVPDEPVVGREVEFEKVIDGVEFAGVIDLLTERTVCDYKTTGSDLKWAKNSNKLKDDAQRLLYMEAYPETERALWITGSWKSMTAVAHERKRESKDKERFKLNVLQPAEEILALPVDVDPLSLPLPEGLDKRTGRPEACGKFPPRGCEFQKECFAEVRTMRDVLKDLAESTPEPVPVSTEAVEEAIKAALSNKEVSEPPEDDRSYLIEYLYVDCFPMHLLATPLETSFNWVHKASQEVCADLGVQSVMLIDFGKGPHLMCAELVHQLEQHGKIEHFHLETRSAEGKALMQALTARARFVFKGAY